MKKKAWILIAACLALLLAAFGVLHYFASRDRVLVCGTDLGGGGSTAVGKGTAAFDPETRVLRLENVYVDWNRAACVKADRAITVEIIGTCMLVGRDYGITSGGDLTVTGTGDLTAGGGKAALRAAGAVSLPGFVSVRAAGEKAVDAPGGFTARPLSILRDQYGGEIAEPGGFVQVVPPVKLSYSPTGGSAVETREYRSGDAPGEYASTEREGFAFAGWYTALDYASQADPASPLTEDTTVYAMWDKVADEVWRGIDVSAHQEEIDWEKVGAGGDVAFAILRAGFRGYGETGSLNADKYFDANYEGASSQELLIGAYFYTQATNEEEAREEARFALEILNGRKLDLPVFYDLEYAQNADGYVGRLYNAGLDEKQLLGLCLAFADEMERGGYPCMVYANCRFLSRGLGELLDREGIGVWLAHYAAHTYYEHDYEAWQYSSKGKVDGISGSVDMNEYYVLLTEEEKAERAARQEEESGTDEGQGAESTPMPTLRPPATQKPEETAQPGPTGLPTRRPTPEPEPSAEPESEGTAAPTPDPMPTRAPVTTMAPGRPQIRTADPTQAPTAVPAVG